MLKAESDLDRQARVVDQMVTAHAILRDRHARRSRIVEVLLFSVGVVLATLSFAGPWLVTETGLISELEWRAGLGLASLAIVLGSVAQMVVRWNAKSEEHAIAVRQLSSLKNRIRTKAASDQNDGLGIPDWEYSMVMANIAPIPETEFNRLKAAHLHKVAISKKVSEHPSAPAWVVGFVLRTTACRDLLRRRPSP